MGRVFYSWRSASGKTGRSTEGGILRLLRGGTIFTRLQRPRRASAATRLVRAAQSQVGVVEDPPNSNTGAHVRKYQAATTVPGTRWPYCMAGVRWCMDVARIHLNGYRGAYCPHFEAWGRAKKLWRSRDVRPRVGWAVLFGRGAEAEHVGIVVAVHPDGSITTVEFNTSPGSGGSQANGGGVYRRVRNLSWVRGYVAIVNP